jgi:hypothetical protein
VTGSWCGPPAVAAGAPPAGRPASPRHPAERGSTGAPAHPTSHASPSARINWLGAETPRRRPRRAGAASRSPHRWLRARGGGRDASPADPRGRKPSRYRRSRGPPVSAPVGSPRCRRRTTTVPAGFADRSAPATSSMPSRWPTPGSVDGIATHGATPPSPSWPPRGASLTDTPRARSPGARAGTTDAPSPAPPGLSNLPHRFGGRTGAVRCRVPRPVRRPPPHSGPPPLPRTPARDPSVEHLRWRRLPDHRSPDVDNHPPRCCRAGATPP